MAWHILRSLMEEMAPRYGGVATRQWKMDMGFGTLNVEESQQGRFIEH